MSAPEITPELLRRIINHPDAPHDTLMGLKAWADRMEREQAAEKRIEELVSTFWSAYSSGGHIDDVATSTKRDLGTGIRAVLAKLDEERVNPYSMDGHLAARNTYGDPGADPASEWHTKPRQWTNILDIPSNVRNITDANGMKLQRAAFDRLWRDAGTDGAPYPCVTAGPYTEIVGGDQ